MKEPEKEPESKIPAAEEDKQPKPEDTKTKKPKTSKKKVKKKSLQPSNGIDPEKFLEILKANGGECLSKTIREALGLPSAMSTNHRIHNCAAELEKQGKIKINIVHKRFQVYRLL